MADARWTVTCTAGGAEHLSGLSGETGQVHLVYHGLDLNRFAKADRKPSDRDGSKPDDAVRLVSVGRAVRKKGFDVLIKALAKLPDDLNWQWVHAGGGDLEDELKTLALQNGIAGRTDFRGSMTQAAVLSLYRESDLFVLPCRIAGDGDRDGLPNVLVEAQSQALACISTPISGIPELLRDGENGILVEAEDPDALAAAIAKLVRDPKLRAKMGEAGERRVRAEFDHTQTIAKLVQLFDSAGLRAG